MKGSNENKFATVQIEYDVEKLEAVRFFLMDKNSTVERELLDAMDTIFKKHVPAQVRDYIERKNAPRSKPVKTEQ
jgi:hypothetical protein